ncbi:hypothetical protein MLD38_023462 [Melastoma candidum]|uniref:Uncharacterized protein n=1 Tax=Melastoma candidum TaxID=119954 RepID=A0ACB9NPA3_9MYRT|nr:hypothetical protein MLD38_023462 [Melastoma candidum]
MPIYNSTFVNTELSKQTSIFGLRLWVVIGVFLGSLFVLTLFLLSICLTARRRRRRLPQLPKNNLKYYPTPTPPFSKEIQEVVVVLPRDGDPSAKPGLPEADGDPARTHHANSSGGGGGANTSSLSGTGNNSCGSSGRMVEVSHLGWGRWYTLREVEEATSRFSPDNVIGDGSYGIVYSGVLADGTKVAVKNLLNNRGEAEKEFKVEVEAIGRVRHKNLVRLLGYCVEGAYRMLVYEYVDNGNLDQWLHGDVGDVSPLSWNIRINIILGTAKGLAYLHEGLEPKVVHRDVKSSNILLDRQWNPKVSDFGLAKLLCSETSYVSTRIMGTFGYVAPEYACTGMLNEKSDVYSFGILVMEIITGRNPVDYSRPEGEVNLVDWLKTMVADRKAEEVVDPKLPETPTPKALKRILLVALRCVDPEGSKRPKMGHVVHMLEADNLLFNNGGGQSFETEASNPNRSHGEERARSLVHDPSRSDSEREYQPLTTTRMGWR